MRVRNSIKNIYVSILSQIVITLLGFISRKVFINSLGAEYLGINGLLTNVLSMLSLVEGGIGTSIIFNLYKPLAEKDEKKIISLVQLYKKLYGVISVVVFCLSLMLYPFLDKLIKGGTNIKYLGLVYFIFVVKNSISYLNAHKWSLINADQKGYVLTTYNLIFNIITTISKIIILRVTNNYIIYLLIELLIFIIQNIWNGKIVNNYYPFIKSNRKYKLDLATKENIVENVKAIFLHNIGSYCVYGTDNLLISSLINLKAVGLYSNYTMIISQLSSLLTPILSGIGASVGNLIATESKEKSYDIFNTTFFINYWIYSTCSIFLLNLLEPFIDWWLGGGLLLDRITFIIILVNFYLSGMRTSINIFKSKAGIFTEDKYAPLIESVINLSLSLILAKYFGLIGIFLGTTISTITVPLWIQSKLVYNKIFNKSVFIYFRRYIIYAVITIFNGILVSLLCNLIQINIIIISLTIKGIICIIVPSMINLIIFKNSNEGKYIISLIKNIYLNIRYKNSEMKKV